MNKSESIENLAKALCEVQKTELFALTDKANPFFKSKYADLSSVWSAIRKPLTENGLSVVQTMDTSETGVIVETTLLHTSGEYISGRLQMTPEKATPQGVGTAITYARRYSLAAIIGISPIDDDAEGAMNRKIPPEKNDLTVEQWNLIKLLGKEKEMTEDETKELVQFCASKNKISPRNSEIAKLMLPKAKFQEVLDAYLDSLKK